MTIDDTARTLTRRGFGLATFAAASLLAGGAAAEDAASFPSRPIRILVPFPPGGGADLLARMVAPRMQETLGGQVIVENRSGAAGRIGTGVVANSDPDGYTLLMSTEASIVIAPHSGEKLTYDPLKSFAPISLLTRNLPIFVVHPSHPAKTMKEFIAIAREKPGELLYGSSGVGGPNHLAAEVFQEMAGVKLTHVPFQGTGAAIPAVLGNQVGAMVGFMGGLIPHIRGGRLRVLAVCGAQRSAALPDTPTVAESGVPGYDFASWLGMLAPAAVPQPILDEIGDALVKAMKDPEVRAKLTADGSELVVSSPAEFRKAIDTDYARYGKLKHLIAGGK